MPQTLPSKKITMVDKPNLRVILEYNEDYVAIHLPHVNLTKETYEEMLVHLDELNDFVKTVGYEYLAVAIKDDPKVARLAKKMNFKYVGAADGFDVYVYEE